MRRRRRITIDIGQLAWAFENHDYDHLYYLDLDTGEVLSNVGDEDPEELASRVEAGIGTRYLAVEPPGPGEGYQDMADFIEVVADPTLRATLMGRPSREFSTSSRECPRNLPSRIGRQVMSIAHPQIREAATPDFQTNGRILLEDLSFTHLGERKYDIEGEEA